MNLIAQQTLVNWIGVVAELFDRFPINGSAEKLSRNLTIIDFRARSETDQ